MIKNFPQEHQSGPRSWGNNGNPHLKIPAYHPFVLEHMIHMPGPEWSKGKHLYIAFHEGAVVTGGGVEFQYSPSQGIRIIR